MLVALGSDRLMPTPMVRADGLRLALFTDTYPPQVNGVARTLGRLVDTVRARGGEVRVFTTSDPTAGEEADIVRFPSLPFWAEQHYRISLPLRSSVAAELERWGATLVHAATPFGVGLAGRGAAKALNLPLVTSYHTSLSAYAKFYGLGALTNISWHFLRWFHNSGERTYCPSEATRHELEENGFHRTAIWSRGVDSDLFSPVHRTRAMRLRLGASDDTIVVAYVGRMAAEKGLSVALEGMREAASMLPGRFVFAFAGDGPYRAHCQRTASHESVFLGRITGKELSAFYASADIFVFPSMTDTFGNVLLEAAASGLPVVAADAAPTRELITPESGLLFSPEDARALGVHLVTLALDRGKRAAMRLAALRVAARWSWDGVFDGLVKDYWAVVKG